jgi:hypothetical protein
MGSPSILVEPAPQDTCQRASCSWWATPPFWWPPPRAAPGTCTTRYMSELQSCTPKHVTEYVKHIVQLRKRTLAVTFLSLIKSASAPIASEKRACLCFKYMYVYWIFVHDQEGASLLPISDHCISCWLLYCKMSTKGNSVMQKSAVFHSVLCSVTDPCLWLKDPDSIIFVIEHQEANKKKFYKVFLLITFWRYIYIIFQRYKVQKQSQNSRNQGFFLTIFAWR